MIPHSSIFAAQAARPRVEGAKGEKPTRSLISDLIVFRFFALQQHLEFTFIFVSPWSL